MDAWVVPALIGFGLIMGFLTANVGLRARVEFPAWTVVYLAIGWFAAVGSWTDLAWFAGGGAIGGVGTGLLQTLLLDNYRTNNPWYADKAPATRSAAAKQFIPFGTIMGLVWALAFGGISWGLTSL